MRDRLVHGYDTVAVEVVWLAATASVPDLVKAVKTVLEEDR